MTAWETCPIETCQAGIRPGWRHLGYPLEEATAMGSLTRHTRVFAAALVLAFGSMGRADAESISYTTKLSTTEPTFVPQFDFHLGPLLRVRLSATGVSEARYVVEPGVTEVTYSAR